MSKSTAENVAVAQADGVELVRHFTVYGLELLGNFCRGTVMCANLASSWIAELYTKDCPPLGIHLKVGVMMRKLSAPRLGEHIPAADRRNCERYDAGAMGRFVCLVCSKDWGVGFPTLVIGGN